MKMQMKTIYDMPDDVDEEELQEIIESSASYQLRSLRNEFRFIFYYFTVSLREKLKEVNDVLRRLSE